MIETDAVIIGAGPVGLFQVFELGLLDVKAHVIEALPYAGGQCVELYPDKPIYDIPALPVCTGRELTDNLLRQIAPFGATFHYGQEVSLVEKQADGRFLLETNRGTRFCTKTIFIAAGVGAFQPRTLNVNGLDTFQNTQLAYRVDNPADYANQNIVIVGGEAAAVEWALRFCANHPDDYPHKAKNVIVLHRRDHFTADPAAVSTLRALCDSNKMQFMGGQIAGFTATDGQLSHLRVDSNDGVTRLLPVDKMLVFLGLSPKLGTIAEWGLALERKQLVVDTEKFCTSEPGIFAVGDINTYPGKKKLILCGFHECTLAAFGAMPFIFPDKKVFLQYTTSSPRLHKALGVGAPIRTEF